MSDAVVYGLAAKATRILLDENFHTIKVFPLTLTTSLSKPGLTPDGFVLRVADVAGKRSGATRVDSGIPPRLPARPTL